MSKGGYAMSKGGYTITHGLSGLGHYPSGICAGIFRVIFYHQPLSCQEHTPSLSSLLPSPLYSSWVASSSCYPIGISTPSKGALHGTQQPRQATSLLHHDELPSESLLGDPSRLQHASKVWSLFNTHLRLRSMTQSFLTSIPRHLWYLWHQGHWKCHLHLTLVIYPTPAPL